MGTTMRKRLGLVGVTVALLIPAPLFAGLAGGAASGRVIGMTSGGGSKGYGIVTFGAGLGRTDTHETMKISTPIGNLQGGEGVFMTITGGQLTATLTNPSASCLSFTTGATTWTGSGTITFVGSTGTIQTMTFKHYSLTFWHGVSYANEKASVAGDGVKDGSETGFDSFFKPAGFSCSTAGSVLKSLSVLGVLKITAP